METKIQKWGNSLGVRIPKHILDAQSVTAGSRVIVSETKEGILITTHVEPTLRLSTLLSVVSSENLHQETAWGDAHGTEVW